MDRLMPFDELNVLRPIVADIFSKTPEERKDYEAYLLDLIEDILLLSYVSGNEAAVTMLSDNPEAEAATIPQAEASEPATEGVTIQEGEEEQVAESVNKKIAGKTWRQRVTEYISDEKATTEDIMRVAETDSHRVYNEAMWNVAEKESEQGKVIYKRWQTMLDDRVRGTHAYLEGETIPLNERFYTFDGDSAMHPGGFTDPANDCGCRCRLVLTRV